MYSPSLIVIFLSSSFLKRTVCTPEIAFTIVDFPCATCPMVPVTNLYIYNRKIYINNII